MSTPPSKGLYNNDLCLHFQYRYDGATEGAVVRCARVALGLPAYGTAHLVWISGDIVDFGKPIEDGVTLYLDAVVPEDYPTTFERAPRRGIVDTAAAAAAATTGADARNRMRIWSTPPPYPPTSADGVDGGAVSQDDDNEDIGTRSNSLSSPSQDLTEQEEQEPAVGAATGTTRQRIFSSWRQSVWQNDGPHKNSTEEERLPLLKASASGSTSASTDPSTEFVEDFHHHNRKKASPRFSVFTSSSSNWSNGSDRSPSEQRGRIVKIKRILAHLANERTYLAWVRAMGKMFTAGTLSLTLAGKTSGGYSVCFVFVGLAYFGLCPYVVFLGFRRCFYNV